MKRRKIVLGENVQRYIVKQGDSLWKIAATECGDPGLWVYLAHLNKLPDANRLLVGQEILIAVDASHHHPSQGTTEQALTSPPPATPVAKKLELTEPSGPASRAIATPVYSPAFKFDFDKLYKQGLLKEVVVDSPLATLKLKLLGEATFVDTRIADRLVFTKDGIEANYKREVDGRFQQWVGGIQASYDVAKKSVELSFSSTTGMKIDGQVWSTTEYALTSDGELKFTYKPRPASGELPPYKIEAVIGYEVRIKPKKPPLQPQEVPVPNTQTVTKIVAIGLGLAAGTILVATIVSNIATLGADAPVDAVSFSMAAALLQRAVPAWVQ